MLLLLCLVFLAVSFVLLGRFLRGKHDPNEPPLIPQPFPLIGHLIGLMWHGTLYYTQLSQRLNLPIYSLNLAGKKVYIVNSPRLAALVDRKPAISFRPLVVDFAKRMLVPSNQAVDALAVNLYNNRPEGCLPNTVKIMHETMAAGSADLEKMTHAMLKSLTPMLNLHRNGGHSTNIHLFAWVKDIVTRASTDAAYGAEENPFKDPEVANALWDFIYDFGALGLNILPSIVARKGNRGRETLFAAFRKYYAGNGHLKASPLVKGRFQVNSSHGLGLEDIAHFDVVNSFALIVNSVPTTFWCIYYLFTRPSLLEELRIGIKSCSHRDETTEAEEVYTVDIHGLFSELPLLSGIVKEVLRVLSTNASVRILSEDNILDDKYQLKKDSLLFLPAPDLHNNATIYGHDFAEFKPERWSGEGAKIPAASFRAFGGGSSLCPGRHLSMNEIMVVVVTMAMRYDMSLVDVNQQWKALKATVYVNISLYAPVEDIEVQLSERADSQNESWDFLWKGEQLGI